MSDAKGEMFVRLGLDNWYEWNRYIKSTIRRKNAYIAFSPEPIDPRTPQTATPGTTVTATPSTTTATPGITVTPAPTAAELKTYREELKEWHAANNIAAGIILGAISPDLAYIADPEEPAKMMYDKLQAEVMSQSSGSNANVKRKELVFKLFKEAPTLENFEAHVSFYRTKNASLIACGAGFDDSFLAWLILNSFPMDENPVWSMASTSIATSDTPIIQWSFNHVCAKLREALQNSIRPEGTSSSGTSSQSALNANTNKMDKTNANRYSRPA